MRFALLPTRSAGTAENMAVDFMLLQRYPEIDYIRFRHYGWHRPAFTFGYSQKIAFVRTQLPDEAVELCRRPTGGGVVDHRHDWTYALVLPRGHSLEEARAVESYRAVHAALAEAMLAQDEPVALHAAGQAGGPPADAKTAAPGVCFVQAEEHDVVSKRTGRKIAGAAQKRNKHGLLFQGSVARTEVSADFDWDLFYATFAQRLGHVLQVDAEEAPWPEFVETELEGLIEQYSSAEWNEFR